MCVCMWTHCMELPQGAVSISVSRETKMYGSQLHPEPSCCSYSPKHLLSIWKHPEVGSNAIPVYFLQWVRQLLLFLCLCNPSWHSVQRPVCFKPSQKVPSIWPYLGLQLTGSQCFFRTGFSVSFLRSALQTELGWLLDYIQFSFAM